MQFTYGAYVTLLERLKKNNYEFASYHNWKNFKRCVILRHDIDYVVERACHMAQIESNEGVGSTYFVLVTSDLYNIFSKKNVKMIKSILALGHEIGLHFDEMAYPDVVGNVNIMAKKIIDEKRILEQVIESPVTTVSMHRPSRVILESDLEIPEMVNSYGRIFFHEFKYMSDSRRNWREPAEELIESKKYLRLHILTHPFWYHDKEQNIHDEIYHFINEGNMRCYETLKSNFTNLEGVMEEKEILAIR